MQALMDNILLGEINTALDNLIDSNCITADQVHTIVNHIGSFISTFGDQCVCYF